MVPPLNLHVIVTPLNDEKHTCKGRALFPWILNQSQSAINNMIKIVQTTLISYTINTMATYHSEKQHLGIMITRNNQIK